MAVTTVRTKALNLSTSVAQAGLVFDEATRLLVGRLRQNAVTAWKAAIQGLKSGNAALAAARAGFNADAKDVSGNNVPVTGGNSMVRQIQW